MNLKKCPSCKIYTLKQTCSKCKKPTKQAGYKFKRVYKKDGNVL